MDQGDEALAKDSFIRTAGEFAKLIGSAFGGLVVSTGLVTLILYSRPDVLGVEELSLEQCVKMAFFKGWIGIHVGFSILSFGFAAYYLISKKNKAVHRDVSNKYDELSKSNQAFCRDVIQNHQSFGNDILETIQDKEIVLYPGMKTFNLPHVLALEQLLCEGCNGPQNSLLALDATEPPEWWTNNMLGYLAIQARWVSRGVGRSLKRTFVWERSAIGSPAGKKLLLMHHMFGFETFICPDYVYFKDILKNSKANDDQRREFLIWDDKGAVPVDVPTIGMGIFGYDSYWNTYHTRQQRDQVWEEYREGVSTAFRPVTSCPDVTYRTQFRTVESIADVDPNSARVLKLDHLTSQDASSAIDAFVMKLKKF